MIDREISRGINKKGFYTMANKRSLDLVIFFLKVILKNNALRLDTPYPPK